MNTPDRESIGDPPNPLGLDGIEYLEYTTTQPQALGQVLETMGSKPVARHRSREVLLYRKGGMNIVGNAHAGVLRGTAATDAGAPRISAARCVCVTHAPPMNGPWRWAPGTCPCTRR